MDIFFTKIDNEIESEMQRDPLGEEKLWTNYANKLFPYVNSVTNELKGYVIAALIKDIIKTNEIIGKIRDKDYQIGSEIIIMFLMLEKNKELNKDISFLGKNNGTTLTHEQKNFILKRSNKISTTSEKREILVRQEQLGYYGRYHSKIENNYLEILDAVFENNKERKEKIKKWLSDKSERIYEGIEYSKLFEDDDNEMKESLFLILKLENSKINNKIFEILKIRNNKNILELYNEIKNLKQNEEVNPEIIINKVINELNDIGKNNELKNLLEYISYLEKFLVEIENLFYEIIDKENFNIINNDCQKLKTSFFNLQKFEYDSNGEYKEITCKDSKYKNLINFIEAKSSKEIIIGLIKDHEAIMKRRKNVPWVGIQNGDIIVNHKVKQDYSNTRWTHNYFINNVVNIIRSTNQWK